MWTWCLQDKPQPNRCLLTVYHNLKKKNWTTHYVCSYVYIYICICTQMSITSSARVDWTWAAKKSLTTQMQFEHVQPKPGPHPPPNPNCPLHATYGTRTTYWSLPLSNFLFLELLLSSDSEFFFKKNFCTSPYLPTRPVCHCEGFIRDPTAQLIYCRRTWEEEEEARVDIDWSVRVR